MPPLSASISNLSTLCARSVCSICRHDSWICCFFSFLRIMICNHLLHPFITAGSFVLLHLQPVASTINTLAGALYKVFSASPDEARNEMRQACFDYLSLGGVCSSGPVSLLSGLNPRPLSLVCHFFAVAIYGVGRLLLPFPSPKRMWIGARLISVSTYFEL